MKINKQEFVKSLGSYELYRLQELVKEELDIINNSEKMIVWSVYNGCYNKHFRQDDYQKAIGMLAEANSKVTVKECEDFIKWKGTGQYPSHLFRKNLPSITVELVSIKDYEDYFKED